METTSGIPSSGTGPLDPAVTNETPGLELLHTVNLTELMELLVAVNRSGVLQGVVCGKLSDTSAEEADDAIWILTSTFIIFTMQSGR